MRRWIALMVCMVAGVVYATNITVTTISGFQLHFTTNGGNATLSSVTASSNEGFVEVPAIITDAGISYVVTDIGQRAFFNCTKLTGVALPEGVQKLGSMAFYNCTALDSIVLPTTLTSIGTAAFNQTAYAIDDNNWHNGMLCIGHYLIALNCADLPSEVFLPDSLLGVGAYAAGTSCGAISILHLPSTLHFISDMAFTGCTALDTLVVEAEVPPTLGSDVFVAEGMQVVVSCQSVALYSSTARWSDLNYVSCPTEGVEFTSDAAGVAIWSEEGTILVKPSSMAEVLVYDAKGVLRASGYGMHRQRFLLPKGIYFVKVSGCTGKAVIVR